MCFGLHVQFSSSLLGSAAAREVFWGDLRKRLFKLSLLELKGWIGFSESCLDLNALILAVFKKMAEYNLMWLLQFVSEPVQQDFLLDF